VLLLLVAASRQALEPPGTRLTSLGVLLVGFGLLHLMLRRHLRRALVSFGALGLGSSCSRRPRARPTRCTRERRRRGARRDARRDGARAPRGRVARAVRGSPFVADAHELHD